MFLPVWEQTQGNDGYVSFELDPLLEDAPVTMPVRGANRRYIELGKKWSKGHQNRMIKVPATPPASAPWRNCAAAGVTLNVTLIFAEDQYTHGPRCHLARRAAARSDG